MSAIEQRLTGLLDTTYPEMIMTFGLQGPLLTSVTLLDKNNVI